MDVSRLYSDLSARGVSKEEEVTETPVAMLAFLVRGDGVSGIRPPAVLVLKMPWWLFRGVDTDTVAMVSV